MTRPPHLAVAWATLLLAGCGQPLGTYSVEAVTVAEHVPLPADTVSAYGRFLEIRLASRTSLTALAEGVDGVYVDADFCPLTGGDGLIAFGPFGVQGEDLGVPSAAPALRPGADGRFHYRVYVPVAHRARLATKPGQSKRPTYDLRGTERDLCLRLFAPGYDLITSRSETIRVPADMVAPALREAAGGSSPS